MSHRIRPASSFSSIPWKNGLGTTLELLIRKSQDPDQFLYRLSIATVEEDGSFSDFSGYHRTLILMQGNGVTLEHGNGQVDVLREAYDVAHFSGGWRTTSVLTDGPITDFNVMTLTGKCYADVQILSESGRRVLSTPTTYFYAAEQETECALAGEEVMRIPKMGLLEIEGRENAEVLFPELSGTVLSIGIGY
jgi:environmental stress-induced protein Ves